MSRLSWVAAGVALVSLLTIGLSGCITDDTDSSQLETVRVGYVPIPQNTLTMLAIKKGFFAEEGIRIEETKANFIGNIFQALTQNQIDVIVGGETPAVFMAFKKGPFTIIGQTAATIDDVTLLVKTNSGINSLSDLQGKKVGLVLTSVSHYNLWKSLESVGVDPKSVTFADVAPANMAAALDKGDIDAIYQWEPIPFKIQKQLKEEVHVIPTDSSWIVAIFSSSNFLSKKDQVDKLIRGWKKAEQFRIENPDDAAKIVGNELGIEPHDLKQIWDKMEFKVAPFTSENILTSQAQWAIDAGLVTDSSIPVFSNLIQNRISAEGTPLP